jgi:hypothetical protein
MGASSPPPETKSRRRSTAFNLGTIALQRHGTIFETSDMGGQHPVGNARGARRNLVG